jgi:hypothetical protein
MFFPMAGETLAIRVKVAPQKVLLWKILFAGTGAELLLNIEVL